MSSKRDRRPRPIPSARRLWAPRPRARPPRRRRQARLRLLLLAFLAPVLAGCRREAEPAAVAPAAAKPLAPAKPPEPAQAPAPGGTLVVGERADASSLNPLSATNNADSQIISLLFLNLTRIRPDLSRAPSLARSWEFSENHRVLTFHLRDDVRWTDGEPVTAADVVFTHRLAIDPAVRFRSRKWKRFIEKCEAVDDHTARFTFSRAYPEQVMDASVCPAVPRHLLEDVPPQEIGTCEFNRHPVGNGPFRLDEWRAGESIRLVANDDYCEGRPPLDRVIFKIVPEISSLILQLESGEVDLVTRVPKEYYERLSGVPRLRSHVLLDRIYYYIGWNERNPLFASRKTRRALTMAIDRDAMLQALYGEFAEPCNGPVSPLLWGHDPDLPVIPHDPAGARAILAEEGWKDRDGDGWLDDGGREFSFELLANRGNEVKVDTAQYVQEMLRAIGVEAKFRAVEDSVYQRRLIGKDFDAAVAAWGVGLKMDMTVIWHSKSIEDKYNFVSYSNPEFDRLNDAAILEPDREAARKLWRRAQEIIVEDQPYTFLYLPKQINFIDRRFRDVRMEAIGWHDNLEKWWVPKELRRR